MAWVATNKIPSSTAKSVTPAPAIGLSRRNAATLNMYSDMPSGEISLEEFERYALDRLKVLRGIEDLRARGHHPDQIQDKILSLADAHLKGASKEETARKDSISHFVLRLGFCLTEDKRKWFLTHECDLFKARFRALLPDEQRYFMTNNDLPYTTLDREEFEDIKGELSFASHAGHVMSPSLHQAAADGFYKVPFEVVPDLVSSRKVYLRLGNAYVSREQVSSLVVQPFRARLSKAMITLARDWNSYMAKQEACRLAPLVEGLSRRYLGPSYSDPSKFLLNAGHSVVASDIPKLSYDSFPLCMVTMVEALRRDGHLKHTGRQQLGLFLKGIGLPLEEAVRFWRTEMAQYAPGDKFDKQYLYNIRHNYGKEGKRQDYTPHSCSSIISTVPGVGQVHGCPYRLFSEESLRSALTKLSVQPAKIEESVAKAKGGHFQLACAAVWEGKMGCSCDTGINHPNQYYEESRKVLASQRGDAAADVEMKDAS